MCFQTACCLEQSKTLPPSLEWFPLRACPETGCSGALGCFGGTVALMNGGNLYRTEYEKSYYLAINIPHSPRLTAEEKKDIISLLTHG